MHVCGECGGSYDEAGFCPADGTALADRGDDLLLGLSLGQYRVARLLGVGGMGRVYKAVHPDIGSRVAVKVLSRDCADRKDLVERFFSEARAANLIRHENIVNVLDLATLPDGRPYIIMEYLDGVPLADIYERRGQLPLGSLARLAGEVLDALGAAHAKSIVHRDLKPDNIYVSPQGHATVLDFGIAKLMPEMSGRSAPTRTGSLLGTPHYMAPEQAMAQPVDARTDIYSMGVILFEGACGRKPFQADSLFELLRQVVDQVPPPPRSLRPDLPPGYEAVIVRAMAKDPNQRFQAAGDLANALAQVTSGLPADAWAPISLRGQPSARIGPPSVPTPSAQHQVGSPVTPLPTPNLPTGGPLQPNLPTGDSMQPTLGDNRSRAGLWIGLGLLAAAAIAGGVVLAASGGDDETESASAVAPPAAPSIEPVGLPTVGLPPGTPTTPGASGATTDQLPSATELAQQGADLLAETNAAAAAATAALNQELAGIDDALSKVGGTKKPGRPATARVVEAAEAPAPPALPPAPASSPPDAGASRAVARRGGFDPSAFDVTGYLPTALAKARATYSDAVLVRIDADGVYPNGRADLTLDNSFSVLYRFVSPSRAKRPADLPEGVTNKPNCKFYVNVTRNGISPYPLNGWECDEPLIGRPKCSVSKVWKEAASLGAPSKNAVASVGYWAGPDGKGRWLLSVGKSFSNWIADSCR